MLDKSFCPILNKWLWTTTIFINDIPLVLYTSSRWTSYQSKYRFTRYFIFPQSTLYFLQRFIIGSLSSKYLWTNMGQNWALCTIIKPPFNCTTLVQIFGGFCASQKSSSLSCLKAFILYYAMWAGRSKRRTWAFCRSQFKASNAGRRAYA